MFKNKIIAGVIICLLSGCGQLPASGPYSKDISGTKLTFPDKVVKDKDFKYALIDINQKLADSIKDKKLIIKPNYNWPALGSPQSVGVRVGDGVSITIYESQSGGLFIPTEAGVRPGNFVTIPVQTVEPDGIITVPFAGVIDVLGRTSNDISAEITKKLGVRAIEPQVIVTITQRVGDEVSIIGEVGAATKLSLALAGEKILDVVAKAGGNSLAGYDTNITLQRGRQKWTAPFEDLVEDANKNIYLRGRDTIYLYREAQSFQAYGAVNSAGKYDFGKRDLMLAEAMGLSRGLDDNLADPEEIYIYRIESLKYLSQIGFELPKDLRAAKGESFPIIYKLNLRGADGFFMAQQFPMRKDDIIYIANAESVEFIKFLNIINPSSITKINTKQAIKE